jgi:hypothetical protein
MRRRKPRLSKSENAKGMKKVLLEMTKRMIMKRWMGRREPAGKMQGMKLQK